MSGWGSLHQCLEHVIFFVQPSLHQPPTMSFCLVKKGALCTLSKDSNLRPETPLLTTEEALGHQLSHISWAIRVRRVNLSGKWIYHTYNDLLTISYGLSNHFKNTKKTYHIFHVEKLKRGTLDKCIKTGLEQSTLLPRLTIFPLFKYFQCTSSPVHFNVFVTFYLLLLPSS